MTFTSPPGRNMSWDSFNDFSSSNFNSSSVDTIKSAGMYTSSATDCPSSKTQQWMESEAVAYSRLLLSKKHGFPLWQPEPESSSSKEHQKTGVTVGDLGFITSDGAFNFFFNVCLPGDHPINDDRVPPGFEPFELDLRDVVELPDVHAPGCVIASPSVSWKGSLGPKGSSSSSAIDFSCSPWEGALLVLPEGGTGFDLSRLDSLRRYVAENVQSWYRWLNTAPDRAVRNESLYLVTGADMTASWGVASYQDYHGRSSLTLSVADSVNEYPYVWESSGRGETRAGPKRGQGPSECRRNQCVFIRGYRVDLNEASALAPASLSEPTMLSSTSTEEVITPGPAKATALSSGGTTLQKAEGAERDKVNKPYHPSNIINQYLLNAYPEAKVAITHDDDWCSVLLETDQRVPDGSELLNRILAQRQPVLEDGHLYLAPIHDNDTQDMVSAKVASVVAPPYGASRTSRTPEHYQSHNTDPRSNRYAYSSFSDASLSRKPEPLSRSVSAEPSGTSSRPRGSSVGNGKAADGRTPTKKTNALPTIDMETFRQILDLDEDDTYEFSWGMAWAYFSQAKTTFEQMNEALAKKDLAKLSALGHFLKGSSAALGVSRVQASCEKIQHYGVLRDEELGIDLTPQEASEKIKRLLVEVQADYKVAEQWLRDWFDTHRTAES